MQVRNRVALIGNGGSSEDKRARTIALDIVERVLGEADPNNAVKNSMKLSGEDLILMEKSFHLKSFKNLFVLGAGKAAGGMAEAVEGVLGSRLVGGFVNLPEGTGERFRTRRIVLNESSHPLPNESGVAGAKKMLDLAARAGEEDLVIVLISGGASSLLPLPAGDLTLDDIQSLSVALLRSGAVIDEINIVRKHLSRVKGGGLAAACYPATVISLIISDVVGDSLDVIASGPTVSDPSTFEDAIAVMKKYGLLDRFPRISRHLEDGSKGVFPETLKRGDPVLERVHNFLISTNKMVLERVVESISNRFDVKIISTSLVGEARVVGERLGSLLVDEGRLRDSNSRPRLLLAGGETTVKVSGDGRGGRNQELVLSSISVLRGEGVCIASFGSDGVDGDSDAAGAVADGRSWKRAEELNLQPSVFLDSNDSYNFFKRLGDLILTGPTGTNVNDTVVMVVV
jgi:glycerate-2-kinase